MECPSNSVISVLLANYEVRRPEDVAGTRVHSAPGSDASPTMVAADKIGSQAQGSQRQRELMCVRRIRSGSEHILARQDGEGPASSAFSTSSSSSSASSEKASVSFPARRQLNDTPPADDSTRNSGNCTSFSVNVAGVRLPSPRSVFCVFVVLWLRRRSCHAWRTCASCSMSCCAISVCVIQLLGPAGLRPSSARYSIFK